MERALITIQVTEEEKAKFQEAAKERELTMAMLVKKGAGMFARFDLAFWNRVEWLASKYNVPPFLFIQNSIIRLWADRLADVEVNGPMGTLDEFVFDGEGCVTGERLLNMLKAKKVRELEWEKADRLRLKPAPCPEDAEWLKKFDERFANAEAAQERARERQEKGLTMSFSEAEGKSEEEILAEMKAKREKAGIK